jgi:hypothetical protein
MTACTSCTARCDLTTRSLTMPCRSATTNRLEAVLSTPVQAVNACEITMIQ